MQKELPLLSLFNQFISDTRRGKRLKPNGQKIKPQTVENYQYTLKLLEEFSTTRNFELRFRPSYRRNKREMKTEERYWKKFHTQFSDFLYKEKKCFDNYVGSVFKNVRVFFNYVNKDKLLPIGEFHKKFYVYREEVPIVTLLPEQLQFLIANKEFEESLNIPLKKAKDLFVFGCTVALRFSDLLKIRQRDIVEVKGHYYLCVRSVKTETVTKVKLPGYAVDILTKAIKKRRSRRTVFPEISINQFNRNVRSLAELVGWTEIVGKTRKRNGSNLEIKVSNETRSYRFCDLLSSHTMRRTAVTTMLMLGMPELLVRKISGHSANSKAFFRYVNFVESYLDSEIDKVHEKLLVA